MKNQIVECVYQDITHHSDEKIKHIDNLNCVTLKIFGKLLYKDDTIIKIASEFPINDEDIDENITDIYCIPKGCVKSLKVIK